MDLGRFRTQVANCPNCEIPLQQLGHTEDGAGTSKVWVGENLYRCRDCRQGSNRFVIQNGVVMSAAPEGWLT